VRGVDDIFDFVALVLGTHSYSWLKDLGEEFNLGTWAILFVKQQVELLRRIEPYQLLIEFLAEL